MSKVSKIKINLSNGSVLEKPLVTCFKGTNGNYLVLDNETNGSMGLPIICISKFTGTAAEKIFDQSEWASVKENLKTIIAGTSLPYLNVPETITASEDFFTQLTLPVASFDLLKNVYAPVKEETVPAAPVSAAPVVSTPEVSVSPEMPHTVVEPTAIGASSVLAPAPIIAAPSVEPSTIATPEVPVVAPMIDAPVVSPAFSTPESAPQVSDPAVSVITAPVVDAPIVSAPEAVNETPIANNSNNTISNEDILTMKDMFMKSCENMFDALVKKFENK